MVYRIYRLPNPNHYEIRAKDCILNNWLASKLYLGKNVSWGFQRQESRLRNSQLKEEIGYLSFVVEFCHFVEGADGLLYFRQYSGEC